MRIGVASALSSVSALALALVIVIACGDPLPPLAIDDASAVDSAASPPLPPAPPDAADAADAVPPVACDGGRCDCNRDPADGLEQDVLESSQNCRACGRTCASACVQGACVFAPVLTIPGGRTMAVVESRLFTSGVVADAGALRGLALVDGRPEGSPFVIRNGLQRPVAMGIAGGHVYVAGVAGALYRVPVDVSGLANEELVANVPRPADAGLAGVAARADDVVWPTSTLDAGTETQLVRTTLRDGGVWQTSPLGRPIAGRITAATAGANGTVYVLRIRGVERQILAVRDSCTANDLCETEIATLALEDASSGIVFGEGSLWFTRPSLKRVVRWDAETEALTTFASDASPPVGAPVVIDRKVYWATFAEGGTVFEVHARAIECVGDACIEPVGRYAADSAPLALGATSTHVFALINSLSPTIVYGPR